MDHIDLVECRRPWLRDMHLTAGSTRACGAIADETLERIVAAYRLASAAERDRGVVRGGPRAHPIGGGVAAGRRGARSRGRGGGRGADLGS